MAWSSICGIGNDVLLAVKIITLRQSTQTCNLDPFEIERLLWARHATRNWNITSNSELQKGGWFQYWETGGLSSSRLVNEVILRSYVLYIDTKRFDSNVYVYGQGKMLQGGAWKTDPPSRRPTWAWVSDSVQEIKQLHMQSAYWLEKMLKMISLYVNALLCMLQHIVIHMIRRTDTAELHRVYDNMLQRAQKCIDVQGDRFQHLL